MDNKNKFSKRKPTRLKNFDYNTSGAYFVTICTKNRRPILSCIPDFTSLHPDITDIPQKMVLFSYGIVADKYINQLNNFYRNITVDQYVIMPDHIHLLLSVCSDGSPRTSTPTATRQTSSVSHFVSTFKRFCNKEYGENIWQRGFYDHVIRGREDYEEIVEYICQNPLRRFLKDS